MDQFKECASCASKPGMPILCEACLSNRAAISRLNWALEKARSEARLLGASATSGSAGVGDLLEYRCPNTGIMFQWRVLSIHPGALHQESVIEIESVHQRPGDTHDGKAISTWVPEPMTRGLHVVKVADDA